jgi:PKD repeat protein
MLPILNYKNIPYWLALALLPGLLPSCSPKETFGDIGDKPKAAFTVTPISGKVNSYLLTATTPGAFYYRWDNGDGSGARQGRQVDTAYYPDKGDFTVKLIVLTNGGSDSAKIPVSVAADDPNGCAGKKALLTNCGSKTWVLDQPGGGALWVGDPGGAQWWASGDGDVAERSCAFNDEYTFKKDGTFIFDNKGDIRVDDENSAPWPTDIGLPIGCASMTQIPAKYQAWGSGTHNFKVIGGVKLQVTGLGAFMGLYKVGENGTAATPENVVTFDILEMTASKMVIRKLYSWGQWKFTFKAK